MKKKLQPIALWLVTLIAVATVLLFFESDLLWKVQQHNVFLTTSLFFQQMMAMPGGMLSYLATFFTQHFYYPWVGVILICCWWLLLMWLTKRAFNIAERWTVLTVIPVAILLVANMDLGYWIYFIKLPGYFYVATIGTTAATALLWAFRSLPENKWLRAAFIVLTTLVGYPLMGVYALAAVVLMAVFAWRQSVTALLSMIISYLVVKRSFKSKGFIEAVSMLAMAVPGTVLGVGYIRGFSAGVFRTGFLQGLYGTGLILIIVFVVRSLPTGTRSGISALRQIDKSIEESAYDMGADSFKVFMTVTLPLIKDSFLSGLVTAFVRSITAISAIILLVTPQFLLITVQINEFAEKGSYSLACAFATILIVITYGAVLLMNLFMKHFGTSKKMKED